MNSTIVKGVEDDFRGALSYAFRLLGYRDRSRKELLDKLILKGFSKAAAEATAAYLEERGFIDDRRLAEILKREAVEKKHYGKRGVRGYLMKKGIAGELIDRVSGDDDDYIDSARKLAEKKLRHMRDCGPEAARRKLWSLLERRGFSSDNIRTVIRSLNLKEEHLE